MKGKKFLVLSLTAALLAGSVMSVSAAGVKDVFDANYYSGKYSDLKAAYGTDEAALINHFISSGAREGRVMSPILDVAAYRAAYADLNAAFGDNWDAYVDHYLTYGIKEKRTTGVLFDLADYADKNPDVKAAYGNDYAAIAQHYINFGIREGRPGGSIVKQTAAKSSSSTSNGSSSSSGSTTTTPPAETPVTPPAEVKPAEHVHGRSTLISSMAPTCTEAGYNEWKCNEVLLENKYDAQGNWIGTGPKMVNGQVVTCDAIWKESLAPSHIRPETGNLYVEHATCTADGMIKYTCTRCGETITEKVPALRHEYTVLKKSVASRSCKLEDRGYDIYECVNCHAATTTVYRDPLNHKLGGQPNVEKASTCTVKGSAYGYCDMCGEKVYVDLPLAAHNTKAETVYADAYLLGGAMKHNVYTVEYCKDCKVITSVTAGATDVACVDGNGDGACDGCGLPVNRNVTSQIKEYKVGETFIGKVQ